KKSSREPSSQLNRGGAQEKRSVAPVSIVGGDKTHVVLPFKSALLGAPPEPGVTSMATLEADVECDFLEVLKGSYVGRLDKGVEVCAMQMKLWLAGMHSVRAAAMG
ncbi:hypothetical protein A2U01_0068553, partial [Trifolium medium]|nr:hypothetical protein [Trifolium medium]